MIFNRHLVVSFAAAFVALGTAHASTRTLHVGSEVETDLSMPSPW